MELKIYECNLKEYTIPRLGVRHHRLVCKGLENVYRELEEASKFANTLYQDNELDEKFQEVFIELVTKKLQRQIGKLICKVIKTNNTKRTFVSESKLRSKALNSIKLSNGEEIITENCE
jgi:hypothetical protein